MRPLCQGPPSKGANAGTPFDVPFGGGYTMFPSTLHAGVMAQAEKQMLDIITNCNI